ncbi:MAG: DUF89 family protein [Candidatus Lokiarchaeota archaeon]|nr:DUF89 family protein [Candidatus Lokiarchaeota archaeon]
MKPSFIEPNCAPCLVETALKFLKAGVVGKDADKAIMRGMERALSIIQNQFSKDGYTFEIGNAVARDITAFLENEDIFKDVKVRSNEVCMAMYPALRARVDSLPSADTKIDFCLAAAVAGNVIDVGTAGHDFSLRETDILAMIDEIQRVGYRIDHRAQLRGVLLDPGTHDVLFMLDNAGEIVFDKMLIGLLKERGKRVSCMVRGKPIANDATRKDLADTGIDILCDQIIETTIASLGYDPRENSKEVNDQVNDKDVIIAKGQANLETVSTFLDEIGARHVFLVARVKCTTVAAFQGVRVGDNIVRQLR